MNVFQPISWLFNDQEPPLRQDRSGVQPKERREALHVFAQSALAAATFPEGAFTLILGCARLVDVEQTEVL